MQVMTLILNKKINNIFLELVVECLGTLLY